MLGLDAAGRINAQRAKAAGFDVIFAYHYRNDLAEIIADCHANGVGFVMVGEFRGNEVLNAVYLGGAQGAQVADQYRALGAPPGAGVVETADVNVPPSAFAQSSLYSDSFTIEVRDRGYRSVLYAGEDWCDLMLDAGRIDAIWGTAAAYWNHGHLSARAAARQRVQQVVIGSTVCDVNDVFDEAALGVWWADGIHLAPPLPEPTIEEIDMALYVKLPEDDKPAIYGYHNDASRQSPYWKWEQDPVALAYARAQVHKLAQPGEDDLGELWRTTEVIDGPYAGKAGSHPG